MNVTEMKSDIKVAVLTGPDGRELSSWTPFLDTVCKIHLSDRDQRIMTQDGVCLKVLTIVAFDGISVRKLPLSDIRSFLTKRNTGKVSISPTWSLASATAPEAIDAVLKATGFSFFQPLQKIGRIFLGQCIPNNPNDSSAYKASLKKGSRQIGTLWVHTKKWHTLKKLPSEFTEADIRLSLPSIALQSDIVLHPDYADGVFHFRNNIPIGNLSRDHARGVTIYIAQCIKILLDHGEEETIATKTDTLQLGNIRYKSLLVSDDN